MIHSQSGSMNLHFFVQPYLDPAIITPHMNAFCLPSLLRYEFTFSERPEIYMKGQGRIGDAFKLKDQEVAFSATAMISFYAQRAHRAQRAQRAQHAQRAQRTAAPVLSSANRTLMAFFFTSDLATKPSATCWSGHQRSHTCISVECVSRGQPFTHNNGEAMYLLVIDISGQCAKGHTKWRRVHNFKHPKTKEVSLSAIPEMNTSLSYPWTPDGSVHLACFAVAASLHIVICYSESFSPGCQAVNVNVVSDYKQCKKKSLERWLNVAASLLLGSYRWG